MNAMTETFVDVGAVDAIPVRGSRMVRGPKGNIALFRLADGDVVAVDDRCPHRGGPLSQGIVHGRAVTCPLHNWVIDLDTGSVKGPDHGCVRTLAVRVEAGRILLAV